MKMLFFLDFSFPAHVVFPCMCLFLQYFKEGALHYSCKSLKVCDVSNSIAS